MRHARLLAPIIIAVPMLFGAAAPALAAADHAGHQAGHAAGVKLSAALDGSAGGDSDGTGAFAATADVAGGQLCYTLTAANTSPPAMAHIHIGEAGKSGPPVVSLKVTSTEECTSAPADVLKAIVANPGGYYVNVHTADFPAGAIRGQLKK